MKKIKTNIIIKFAAWMLLSFFTLTFFLCVAGIAVLVHMGAYWDGGRSLRDAAIEQVYSFDQVRIRYILNEYCNGTITDDTEYREMYNPEKSNVFFVIKDKDGNVVVDFGSEDEYQAKYDYDVTHTIKEGAITEEKEFATLEEAKAYVAELEEQYYITVWTYSETTKEFAVTYNEMETYTVSAYVRKSLTAEDRYYYVLNAVDLVVSMRYWIILIVAASFILNILIMIFLCSSAGYKKASAEHKLSFVHRIPFDVYLAFCSFAASLLLVIFYEMSRGDEYEWFTVVMFVMICTCCSLLLASAVVTLSARIKGGKWWKNTFVYRALCIIKKFFVLCFRGIKYVFKNLPLIWQALAVLLVLKVAEFAFLVSGYSAFAYFWLCEFAISIWVVIYIAIALRKLQKAAKEMAGGSLDYRADLAHMPKILREHGENLNNIGEGLKTALSERIKSEHMKAELITNVSHDIKTPLTSIVNYVGLLKKDGLESSSAPEYLEVLERQAAKLKKLTEDLIDASKATSGCIKVNAEPMDINVLLSQASGEYEGKFSQKELVPVLSLCEENPQIFADGGLVWRVFDNLFNNICKYSQKGTRVYLKSEMRAEKVVISFSNISEAQLDISSEELMERFVRGDSSRNTEGSGLGLSIARSLVELQGGTFDIKIDGDLFKVEVVFDIIK